MEKLTAFHGKSKLKKAVLNMLVKQQGEEKNKLQSTVFKRLDTDKSGVIDKAEIKHAFKKSKSKVLNDMNEDKISSMLSEVDFNDNS